MTEICCVGHITSDKVVSPGAVKYLAGGTAWYFSFALCTLDISYVLVTAVAASEVHYVNILRANGIEVKVQPSANTVFFENIYAENQDERTQNVWAQADPFSTDGLKDIQAQIYHLGPLLAGDIPVCLIKTLAEKGRVSLDVQGYLRKVVENKVYATNWAEKKEALPYIDILKADVAEMKALTGCTDVHDGAKMLAEMGVKEVVVTNGSQGSFIYSEDTFYRIPAYRPKEVIDATGCGDTYMAGYLYRRVKGTGLQEAGEFAAAMAGLKTKVSGPFVGTGDDVMKFLNKQ